MERSNLYSSRSMKQVHEFKVRSSSWDFGNEYSSGWGEGDLVAAGFSWPPRSYICSFCKREFRSAQALGGHMNVHRRDRARLRQSPTRNNGGQFSLLNLNLDPNPSFNPNPISRPTSPPPFSSLVTKFPQFTSKLPPLGPPPDAVQVQNCRFMTPDLIKPKALFGIGKLNSMAKEKGCENLKGSGCVGLDLEMGLISQSKEELDLELRLGYT